jgi:transposase
MTDPFAVAGRQWLAGQVLPPDERDTIEAALRQIDLFTEEIATLERDIAQFVLASSEARRLMTVPGVGMISAARLPRRRRRGGRGHHPPRDTAQASRVAWA